MTYLGDANNQRVSHIWDEAIHMHAQITAHKPNSSTWAKLCTGKTTNCILHMMDIYLYGSSHFDNVPILQYDVRVALQRGAVAHTAVNWHASRESDTWGRKRKRVSAESEMNDGDWGNATEDAPFFISFSFLKIFPVSAWMKASPFSQRLRTETPAVAAPTTVFRASAGRKIRAMMLLKWHVSDSLLTVCLIKAISF